MKFVLFISVSVFISGSELLEVFKKFLYLKVMENEKCFKGKW